ncbi:MAG TPA: helix-turn-helix transcriptional regulator [Pseudolabrys sp.]|nr:helix-turn-helix transcriptional regulator [Pseudolabrys sp.]
MTTLSPRQQTICDYVVMGWGSKEIGRELGISPRTVESHREIIYRKMGVRDARELVRKVLTCEPCHEHLPPR